MRVINQHKRIINQPKGKISKLIEKLATKEDKIWPYNKWSAMKFREGLKVGSKGGHGIIRYTIVEYDLEQGIKFQFTNPKGFIGTHEFNIIDIDENSTMVSHTIKMKTHGVATFQWLLFIRWLHDALIEDALDNIENHFSTHKKVSNWSIWVKFWRWVFIKTGNTHTKTAMLHHE